MISRSHLKILFPCYVILILYEITWNPHNSFNSNMTLLSSLAQGTLFDRLL